jgi:AGCS family alanine or glycine:cation symporter
MVGIYVLASLYIVLTHFTQIPQTAALIVKMAFSENAIYGGTVGVLVKGFQRASFSNEAGIGSAAVAHAAAKTDEPVREGLVAMLGPFIDTVIVCSMTAIVVVITGAWNDPANVGKEGVQLTAAAFGGELPWFPYVLTVCVLLFAYSTMISWAYYGERGWIYLVDHLGYGAGQRTLIGYRVLFVLFVYVGTVTKLTHVLDFSDLMILCMAFPNIVGSMLLAPTVKKRVQDYWMRFKAGKFDAVRASAGSG